MTAGEEENVIEHAGAGADTEEQEIDYWTSDKGYTLEDTETGEVKHITWEDEYDENEGFDSNDWYYALPTDSDAEEELVELEYIDGYFYLDGERIDIDADDIVWKDEVETYYEEVPIDEHEVEEVPLEDEEEVEAVHLASVPQPT